MSAPARSVLLVLAVALLTACGRHERARDASTAELQALRQKQLSQPSLCEADDMHLAPWVINKAGDGWAPPNPEHEIDLRLPNAALGITGKPNDSIQQNYVDVVLSDVGGPYPTDYQRQLARLPRNVAHGVLKPAEAQKLPGFTAYDSVHWAAHAVFAATDGSAFVECWKDEPGYQPPNPFCRGWIFAAPGRMAARVQFTALAVDRLPAIVKAATAIDRRITARCRTS